MPRGWYADGYTQTTWLCAFVLVSVVLYNSLRVNQEYGTLIPSLGIEVSLVAKR